MKTSVHTVLPAILSILLLTSCIQDRPDDTAADTLYANSTYGYSFSYPAEKDFKEYSNQAQAIGTLDGGLLEADVEISVYESDPAIDILFDDFIKRVLIGSCAADGPSMSIECTELESENTFT